MRIKSKKWYQKLCGRFGYFVIASILRLSMMGKFQQTAFKNIFPQKIGFEISSELSPKENA